MINRLRSACGVLPLSACLISLGSTPEDSARLRSWRLVSCESSRSSADAPIAGAVSSSPFI